MEHPTETEIKDSDVFEPKEVDDEWTRYLHALVRAPNINMVDKRSSSTSEIDVNFPILELPGTAKLNSDMSKHKRSLSMRGSISRRKKPSRAAIYRLGSSEESIFIDSTEPRQTMLPVADETEESQEKTTKKREADDISPEDIPQRPVKVAAGVKIPGLLGDLMGSKLFNKKRHEITLDGPNDAEPNSPTSGNPASPNLSLSTSPGVADTRQPPVPLPKPETLPQYLTTAPHQQATGPIGDTAEEPGNHREDLDESTSSNWSRVLPSVGDADSTQRPCKENIPLEDPDIPEAKQSNLHTELPKGSTNNAMDVSDEITEEKRPSCEISSAVITSAEASRDNETATEESNSSADTGLRFRKLEPSTQESAASTEAGTYVPSGVGDEELSSLKVELWSWIFRLVVLAAIFMLIILIFLK